MTERPSKFPKMDTLGTSNLMSRVSAFLPHLKTANEQLPLEDSRKIDDLLQPADNQDNDDDEDDSAEAEEENPKTCQDDDDDDDDDDDAPDAAPTIELQIALGDVEANPSVNWLARQEEEPQPPLQKDDDDDEEKDTESKQNAPNQDAIQRLLQTTTKTTTERAPPKGPLITEMD